MWTVPWKAFVAGIHYKIDVNTLHRQDTEPFGQNEIGRIALKASQPLFFDPYKTNHATGSVIPIDPVSNRTVAAGMIHGCSCGCRCCARPRWWWAVCRGSSWR